ncbi:MAG TPA: hypothetical protein VFV93_14740, partial [Thermomicrobiales bacterium]|nr:hypothetical protein [Thermomicrobiales bacterium]
EIESLEQYALMLRLPGPLSIGSHDVAVTYGSATDANPDSISVIDSDRCDGGTEFASAGALGVLSQGGVATATATISQDAGSAAFALTWQGSDFDLSLTAPSGRPISETSTDPDVFVTQGLSSVEIRVADPETGEWDLRAEGIDVPSPEPVSYAVSEIDPAIQTELTVTGDQAGLPLEVRLAVDGSSGPLAGADVLARITDPAGTTRRFTLSDDGAHLDGTRSDGVYGVEAWATALAGAYSIEVAVSGTDGNGEPYARLEAATVSLGQITDTDSDGVADGAELRYGLNPGNPGDGDTDHDFDGIGLAVELAQGTDPFGWDSDHGGESDRSEVAAGTDPLDPSDDAALPTPWLSLALLDNHRVAVSAGASDGSADVRLYRITGGALADLGLRPGAGSTLEDGPLAAGSYGYTAVALSGVHESAPVVAGPVTPVADATSPFVRIVLNDGVWETGDPEVRVRFTDLSGPVAEMRLAESIDELAIAPWVPFVNPTTFTVEGTPGTHPVVAQVRDANGVESNVAYGAVDLLGGASWSAPVVVNDVLTNFQFTPSVALGPGNTAYAAWEDRRTNGDHDIYFSKRDPTTGTWSANERVNNVTTQTQDDPAIAVDAAGNAYVVWTDTRNGATDHDIYFSKRSASTGAWSPSVRVNDDGAGKRQDFPSIAVTSSGDAVAVWRDQRGGGNKKNIYSARLPAGSSTWSANLKVTTESNAHKEEPQVAIGSNGTAYAVWADQRNSGNQDIWFASLASGASTWSANTQISETPNGGKEDPAIGIDSAGNLVAVWDSGSIKARGRPAGTSTWDPVVTVGGSDVNLPSIAVRGDGRAFVAWYQGLATTLTTLHASEYQPGTGTWTSPELLTDPAVESGTPSVAVDSSQVIVLYHGRPAGGSYEIYAKRKGL